MKLPTVMVIFFMLASSLAHAELTKENIEEIKAIVKKAEADLTKG